MLRWHKDIFVAKRQKALHWDETLALGFFRKKKGRDCGHTACLCCHHYKFPRRKPTRAELKAALVVP